MSFGLEVYDERGGVTFTTDDELLIVIGSVLVPKGARSKTLKLDLPDGNPACFAVGSLSYDNRVPIAACFIDSIGNLTVRGGEIDTYVYYGVIL